MDKSVTDAENFTIAGWVFFPFSIYQMGFSLGFWWRPHATAISVLSLIIACALTWFISQSYTMLHTNVLLDQTSEAWAPMFPTCTVNFTVMNDKGPVLILVALILIAIQTFLQLAVTWTTMKQSKLNVARRDEQVVFLKIMI